MNNTLQFELLTLFLKQKNLQILPFVFLQKSKICKFFNY